LPGSPLTLPNITATYAGDAAHSGSSGTTQFRVPGNDSSAAAEPSPAGQYPNEVDLTTTVPANGATVAACATPASSSPPASGGPLASAADPDTAAEVTQLLQEASGASTDMSQALEPLTHDGPVQLNDAMTGSLVNTIQGYLDKAIADQTAAAQQLASGNLGPSETAQLQAQIAEQQQRIDVLNSQLQKILDRSCDFSRFRQAQTPLRHGRARAATAAKKKTGKLTVFGRTRLRNVAVGPLKIRLRVNRRALQKASRGHTSLAVYVRLIMVLPSKVLSHGETVAVVDRLALNSKRR
jgi:hypothetical protein